MEFNLFHGGHGWDPIVTPITQLLQQLVENLRTEPEAGADKDEATDKDEPGFAARMLVQKFKLGRIQSSIEKKDVSLPVGSEVLLPEVGPEYDVDFNGGLSSETSLSDLKTTFISNIVFADKGPNRRVRKLPVPTGITRVFASERHGVLTVRRPPNEDGDFNQSNADDNTNLSIQMVKVLALGKVTVLRPSSSIHYQFEVGTAQPVAPNADRKALEDEIMQDDLCTVTDKVTTSFAVELKDPSNPDSWLPCFFLDMVELSGHHNTASLEARQRLRSSLSGADATFRGDDDEDRPRTTLDITLRLPVLRIEAAFLEDPLLRTPAGPAIYEMPGETLMTMIASTLVAVRQMADALHRTLAKQLEGANISAAKSTTESASTLYYPGLFGDMAAGAKHHYNAKALVQQKNDPIEFLRRLNNHAKRVLIEVYCPNEAAICDIACGHGQDLGKYESKQAVFLYGADISETEIMEARRRVKINQQKGRRDQIAKVQYHVGNLLNQITWDQIHAALKRERIMKFGQFQPILRYDVISCQLAIHYCLKDQDQARKLFRNISQSLSPGGIFYGSCPDTRMIAQRLCSQLKRDAFNADLVAQEEVKTTFSFGNQIYTVRVSESFIEKLRGDTPVLPDEGTPGGPRVLLDPCQLAEGNRHAATDPFDPESPQGKEEIAHVERFLCSTWGLEYHFTLSGTINLQEFVIPWSQLCRIAREYNLVLDRDRNFIDLIGEIRERADRGENKFRYVTDLYNNFAYNEEIMKTQEEVSSFYKVFVFTKLKEDGSSPDVGKMAELPPTPPSSHLNDKNKGLIDTNAHKGEAVKKRMSPSPSPTAAPPPKRAKADTQSTAAHVLSTVETTFLPPPSHATTPHMGTGSLGGGTKPILGSLGDLKGTTRTSEKTLVGPPIGETTNKWVIDKTRDTRDVNDDGDKAGDDSSSSLSSSDEE